MALESSSYAKAGSTGLFTTTLLVEEVDGSGVRIPVTLAQISTATITLLAGRRWRSSTRRT